MSKRYYAKMYAVSPNKNTFGITNPSCTKKNRSSKNCHNINNPLHRPKTRSPPCSMVVRLIAVIPRVVLGCVLLHECRMGVVRELRHIMCRVPPFQDCRCSRVLLLPLPEHLLPKGFGELTGEHGSPGCPWRERGRVKNARGHSDGLW